MRTNKRERGRVDFEIDGHVAVVTLRRPEKLNAVTSDMAEQIFEAARRIDEDPAIRAAIIGGAGERAFCAGSDIGDLSAYGSTWEFRNRRDYASAVWSMRKPLLAAIRGCAIGGGFEIALACNIRIAGEGARFGAGEVKLGWHGGANTLLLPRIAGTGNALRLLLTGDIIDAAEAFRMGIVQQVVPDSEVWAAARAMACRIAENAPIALEATKHLVRQAAVLSPETGMKWQADLQAYCLGTHDAAVGISAFQKKRKPVFRGA